MSSKTRYLQLSDTTIAEYVMNDELDYRHSTCLYLTKLADNHFAILEGLDREISDAGSGYVKLPDNSLVSLNTIAHFNVPTDNSCSEFYSFIDNDYKYIIKEKEENVEKFKVAQDNDESAKYIVSMSLLKLDTCIYTNIKDYTIDKSGKITYNK